MTPCSGAWGPPARGQLSTGLSQCPSKSRQGLSEVNVLAVIGQWGLVKVDALRVSDVIIPDLVDKAIALRAWDNSSGVKMQRACVIAYVPGPRVLIPPDKDGDEFPICVWVHLNARR